MNALRTISTLAALATGLITSAAAASTPVGVWIDHTGRGAVEIAECSGGLCGHVVWLKDAKNKQVCRNQVLGNVKAVSAGVWDKGWIIDPDDNARYTVELKTIGDDRLRVTGYMGSKLFSETMIWRKAPADLQRCDGKETATPVAAPPAPVPAPARPAAQVPAYEIAPPDEAAPTAPPTRQSAAPVAPAPSPAPATVVPRIAAPAPAPAPSAEPAPQPRYSGDDLPQPEPRSGRQASGKGKGSKRDCKLELPYITLNYPCDAF